MHRNAPAGDLVMPSKDMRPELQIVYKNMVANLAAMKKQQWIITNYAVAIFVGIGALVRGNHIQLTPCALSSLTALVLISVLASWWFLIRIQNDLIKTRAALEVISNKYFETDERETFNMGYGAVWLRHLDYLAAFMAVAAVSGALLIWVLRSPSP
jgi:hypothetical protein